MIVSVSVLGTVSAAASRDVQAYLAGAAALAASEASAYTDVAG